jgi:DNA-binding IscR family transcriptional regulator
MLKITAAVRAALKIVKYLAETPGEVVNRKKICIELGLTMPFSGQIMTELRRAGIIDVTAGPGGGPVFKQTCTALDVVEAMSGKIVTSRPKKESKEETILDWADDLEGEIEKDVAARLKREVFHGVA